jgi:cysteinyl-tRNA synthetase
MHNGMVNVGGTKMSKSLGNFTTIRALLESGLSAMALRLFVLQAHYRKPLDFTAEALEAATTGWKGLNAALKLGETHASALGWGQQTALSVEAVKAGASSSGPFEALEQRFIAAMDDDLNSSGALAVLFELARPLRGLANRLDRGDQSEQPADELSQLQSRWMLLRELAAVLGLRSETDEPQPSKNGGIDAQAIEQAIANRKAAKQANNYQEADRIRKSLSDQGIELIDKPGGLTDWRMV